MFFYLQLRLWDLLKMKKKLFVISILAILAIGMSASYAADDLNTTTNLTKAVNDAQLQNKHIVLIFDQKDCYYCDLLKKDTLSDKNVIFKLNESFITVIVDINEQPQLASQYKVFGTPTTVFLDANQTQIDKIEGYVDAGEFLNHLKGM